MAIDNKPTIKPQTVTGAFLRYVAKTIPLAFDESMSYYECICALRDYINQFIDNLNNVNDGLEELQDFYLQLQDYVNKYFENLDVQEEINNKLDQMAEDGSLTNIIKTYVNPIYQAFEEEIEEEIANQNTRITEEITSQNNRINIIDNKVDSAVSGSPLVASSVEGMTETDRVYVNTTDGKWYYYDGDSWEIGGTYQATQLANGSVDILVLDENIQENFTTAFGDFESLGTSYSGRPRNIEGVIDIATGTTTTYSIIDLVRDKIYNFNGYDKGNITGLFITDSEGNIIYQSNLDEPADWTLFTYTIRINTTGLKAYLTKSTTVFTQNLALAQNPSYRIIDKISNTLYLDLTPKELLSYANNHMTYTENTGVIKLSSDNSSTVKVYAIDKGKKYRFKTFSYSTTIRGLIITDEKYEVQYITPVSTGASTNTYVYEAEESGFAFITKYNNNPAEIEIINDTIEYMGINKPGFSKWYAIGDSITAKNEYAAKNYIDYIVEDIPSIEAVNLGVSGSGYKNPTAAASPNTFTNRISRIDSYDLDTDIITVMGSINDMRYVEDSLGELGDTTTDTVYGSLYTFFNTLFTEFNGVRVGCISPITAKEYATNKDKWESYFTALKETCELFNVPFLDVLHTANLRPNNTNFLNEYYAADGEGGGGTIGTAGVHPNSKGYRLFYQRIKEFIKTL